MSSELLEIESGHEARIERIAADLLPRASQLTRLVLRRAGGELSRAEGGMLRTLSDSPRRITELAELEGLAQPTTTALVKRMEQRGWVARSRDGRDGRAVLVTLTASGESELAALRSRYRAAIAEHLHALGEDELADLERATIALGRLLDDLRPGPSR